MGPLHLRWVPVRGLGGQQVSAVGSICSPGCSLLRVRPLEQGAVLEWDTIRCQHDLHQRENGDHLQRGRERQREEGFSGGLASHQDLLRAMLAFCCLCCGTHQETGSGAGWLQIALLGSRVLLVLDAVSSRATPLGCEASLGTQTDLNERPKTSSFIPA